MHHCVQWWFTICYYIFATHLWTFLKCSHYRSGVAQRVGRGIALLFHNRGTRRGWVVSSTPRPHLPPGKTRYPLYRRLGRPQGRSGRTEYLVPAGIRSRTVQPVISRYTDWATGPIICELIMRKKSQRLWKKKIPVVLLHSLIDEVISEEHSKHIFPALFPVLRGK